MTEDELYQAAGIGPWQKIEQPPFRCSLRGLFWTVTIIAVVIGGCSAVGRMHYEMGRRAYSNAFLQGDLTAEDLRPMFSDEEIEALEQEKERRSK